MENIEDFELDPIRHKVILLLATGLPAREVAKQANCSQSTVDRVKADPNCRQKLHEAVNYLYQLGLSKLSLGVEIAIDQLIEFIQNPDIPDRTRLRAIEILLSQLTTFSSHEIKERRIYYVEPYPRGFIEKEQVVTTQVNDGEPTTQSFFKRTPIY
jgi:hypothetical protein